jgi:hypothetical protein
MNSAYYLHVPVTYGYTPVPLKRYTEYAATAAGNPNLLNAMNVGLLLAPAADATTANTNVLPKFFFPKQITTVAPGEALAQLLNAVPFENALVEGGIDDLQQDVSATVAVESSDPQRYVLHSDAKSPSLLRAAIPWYPAWRASVDGKPVEIRIVDHAMIGIPVPAGRHQVVLEYVPGKFRLGAGITILSLAFVIVVATRGTGSRLNKDRR